MKTIKFEGIGTHWWIEIYDELSNEGYSEIENSVLKIVTEFGDNYSRFKETSLLSKLNSDKIFLNPPAEFVEMLEISSRAKNISKGYFDISVGQVLEKMGYDKDYSFEAKDWSIRDSLIVFDDSRIIINENTRIDLGGVGKGYLIDKVKNYLLENGIKYFFINAGGDIYATSNENNPIEFFLENPFNNDEMIGRILIKDESIASSSPSRRKWTAVNNGKEFNHLVNMISKDNIKDVAGVYTLGKTATASDVASTTLFVSHIDLHKDIAKNLEVEFLIVFSNGNFTKSEKYKGELFS